MPHTAGILWRQLEQALLDAYHDRTALSRLLTYSLDFSLDQQFPNEGLVATVFRLLQRAHKEGWLLKLMEAAAADKPNNSEIQDALKHLRSQRLPTAETPGNAPSTIPPEGFSDADLEMMLCERGIRDVSHRSLPTHLKQSAIKKVDDFKAYNRLFRVILDGASGFANSNDLLGDLVKFISESRSQYPVRIDGPPGTGKTTLLNLLYLAFEFGRRDGSGELIPVLLDCRAYAASPDFLTGDLGLLQRLLRTRPESPLLLLIDGVDEYLPASETVENAILDFMKSQGTVRKLVGVSLRYGAEYPLPRTPMLESGDEERRVVLGGVRADSPEEKAFVRAFLALPRREGDIVSAERLIERLKVPSFRLEQVDLMTVSMLATKLKAGRYQSLKTLAEFYRAYCADWLANDTGSKPRTTLEAASRMAFDYAIRGEVPNSSHLARNSAWRLIHSHSTIKDYLIAEHIAESVNQLEINPDELERLDYVYPKPISRFFEEIMLRPSFKTGSLVNKTKELFTHVHKRISPGRYTKLRSVLCFMLGRLRDENVIPLAKAFLKTWIPIISSESIEKSIESDANAHRQEMLLLRTMYVSRIYLKESLASDEYIDKLIENRSWCSLNRGFHLEYYGDIPYEPREYMLHYDELHGWTSTYHYLLNKIKSMLEKGSGYEDLVIYTLFSLAQHRHATQVIEEDRRLALLEIGGAVLAKARIHSVRLRAYMKMILQNLQIPVFAPAREIEHMYHLKFELRKGWVKRGLKNPESVADHSYCASLLCRVMLPDVPRDDWETYDKQKIFELLFAHDFIEAYTGDWLPEEKNNVTQALEERAVEYVEMLATYPDISGVSRLAKLWLEFRNQTTYDARVANDIDKLENLVQLFVLRSGRARVALWAVDNAEKESEEVRSPEGIVVPDFEQFKFDLVNKIRTPPGQYLRDLIVHAFEPGSGPLH
jgi:5'-deoxynucleotidase YfbR-like HD superfamily hydrolase